MDLVRFEIAKYFCFYHKWFNQYKHLDPLYIKSRTNSYYNEMVKATDEIREHSIDNASLFEKSLWKR